MHACLTTDNDMTMVVGTYEASVLPHRPIYSWSTATAGADDGPSWSSCCSVSPPSSLQKPLYRRFAAFANGIPTHDRPTESRQYICEWLADRQHEVLVCPWYAYGINCMLLAIWWKGKKDMDAAAAIQLFAEVCILQRRRRHALKCGMAQLCLHNPWPSPPSLPPTPSPPTQYPPIPSTPIPCSSSSKSSSNPGQL